MASPLAIDLPPGVVKTDSPLTSAGRYVDSDNVRWYRRKPQKLGGNVALLKDSSGAPTTVKLPIRGLHTWSDALGRQLVAGGTATSLFAALSDNDVPMDITPANLPAGLVDPLPSYGWGAGPYGREAWGTPRTTSSFFTDARVWSVDNFGRILLAMPANDTLYAWDPSVSPVVPASAVASAPPQAIGFFTTAERFVVCFGTTGPNGEPQDLMRVFWGAQGLYTDWNVAHTPAELAQLPGAPAGSRQLQFGTRIVGGADIGNFTSLLWTDAAVYTHQYTGSAATFNTLLAGTRCGLLSRHAFAVVAGMAFWMSSGRFWMYVGSVVPIPNADDVSEWFFGQLRQDYGSKAFAFHDVRFGEVWFVIVPAGASEPTLAAVYNIEGQFWFPCTMARTAATVFTQAGLGPVLADASGQLRQHEVGVDDNGAPLPWRLTTGFLEIEAGAATCDLFGLMPDMQRQVGNVAATITALDRTPAPVLETETETFAPTDGVIDLRIAGRELSLALSSSDLGGDMRLGAPKIEFQASGERR